MFDLLIKNGTIVDGTGAPRFKGDIAVESTVGAGTVFTLHFPVHNKEDEI